MKPKCKWCFATLRRGQYVNVFRRNRFAYTECRSRLSCFNRIVKQRDAMRLIGTRMYNVFFNISQRTAALNPRDPVVFAEMRDGWEAAKSETGF